MKVSYNWLQEYISGKLPKPEKVAELLTMHSFEVESVEKVGKDSVLDVAVLPNRAHDCLSHIGVAKELGALLKFKVKSLKLKVREENKLKTSNYLNVEIKDLEKCPFYSARVILDVKVGPSPKWLKERLETLGQKSINNVVDATNYVMLETGQPTHVFDLDKIECVNPKSEIRNPKQIPNSKFQIPKIIVRRARNWEKIEVLGGGEYKLTEQDLVIADTKDALAIAGVKGGVKAEVTGETKNIILESAYFESSSVRATSKRIGLRTDASARFENGVVPTLTTGALDRVAGLIAELAGGKVAGARHTMPHRAIGCDDSAPLSAFAGGAAKAGKVKFSPVRMFFTPDGINKLLGTDISDKEIFAILKRLGFSVGKAKNGYMATAPEERVDVSIFQDLAEEVGRVYGFENISSVLPESVLIPALPNDELIVSDKIKAILSGVGFCETYSRSFVGDKYLDIFSFNKKSAATVSNPMSLDHKYLRPSLLFHLIGNVAENVKHQKNIRLFEIGDVFLLENRGKVLERTILAGVVFDAEFYEMKGVSDLLLEKIGIDREVWYDEYAPGPEEEKQVWHGGSTAEVKVGDRIIGRIGEINPRVLRSFDIPKRVVAFEFYVKDLVELAEEKAMYQPISKFPAVERDIAVLVPASVKVDDVQQAIETAGGELLLDSDLFDIYEENLEAEQKSLAFHLIFQSSERTLTDNEINGIFRKIVEAIKAERWEVRE